MKHLPGIPDVWKGSFLQITEAFIYFLSNNSKKYWINFKVIFYMLTLFNMHYFSCCLLDHSMYT